MAQMRTFKANKLSDLIGGTLFRKVVRQGQDKNTGEMFTIVQIELPDSDEFLEVQVYGMLFDEFPKHIKKYDSIDFEGVEYISRSNARMFGTFAMGELSEQIKVQKVLTVKTNNG